MLQLDFSGNIQGGDYGGYPLLLRESPTLQSLGKHTIAPDPRGYRVSSFFDVFLELSADGGETWIRRTRSMRLLPSHAAGGARHPSLPAKLPAPMSLLQWQNNFTLQSATNCGCPSPM